MSEEDTNTFEEKDDSIDNDSHSTSESEEDEGSRNEIRSDLSTMSFEELMILKEKLGAKVYKEAIFGAAPSESKKKVTNFKRINKNRPREQSSRKQVPFLGDIQRSKKSEESAIRDPRFDKNSGDYDPSKFKENYKFLVAVRENEISDLQQKLSVTKDEGERSHIKFTMQRLKNKNVEEKHWQVKQDILKEEKKEVQKAKNEGRQPHYATKKELRAKELVKKFVELKSSGSLSKHLEKKRKKNAAKDRKKFSFD